MILSFGDFVLDTVTCELSQRGEPVVLQRRVFDLIAYLAERPDRLIPKEELFEHVWGGVAVSEASLAQAVKHARRALGDDADAPAFILTVRGRGYRFAGPVSRRDGAATPEAASIPPPASATAPLVGRAGVMSVLDAGIAAAAAGHARTVLISGEPGIGKSRVLDELAQRGAREGLRVVRGRCYEGDEGAPMLWPWIQVLREVDTFDPEGVAALSRARPGALPGLFADAPPPTSARAEADPLRARFQLFDAITSLLHRASRAAPLLVILDDLDRADEASLLMLQFLVRALRDARLFVAGAHRALPIGARGALPDALGALSREPRVRAVALEGLAEDEVRSYLESALGAALPADVVREAHARTAGNPFFLTQVSQVLRARGAEGIAELPALLLRSSAGDAIRAQLDVLSPACRDMLTAAAVWGVVFDLAPLGGVIDLHGPDLIKLAGEAIAAGIVIEDGARPGRCRFAHALIRDALYAAVPLPRRVELHGRIGEALVTRERGGAAQSSAEIAHHLLQAAPAGGAARAAEYAVRAAEEAARVHAYEEAARLHERALEALDLGPGDPMKRVEVMLALGHVRFRAGDLARSKEVFEQSAKIARELGDAGKLAEAALGYALEDERSAADRRRIAFLEEGLSALAGGDEARRALLTGRLAVAQYFAVERAAREKLGREAVAAARRSADPGALAFALRCLHFVLLAPDSIEERIAVGSELVSLADRLDDREGTLRALSCRLVDRLELGRLAEADADLAAYTRLAAELGQPAPQWTAALFRAGRALMSGQIRDAEAALGGAKGSALTSGNALPLVFQLRRAEERLGEIRDALAESAARAPERALRRALLGLAALAAGDEAQARATLAALVSRDLSAIRVDLEWLGAVACLAEIAAALGDRERASILHTALAPHAGRLVVAGPACIGPVTLFLGLTAAAAGRRAEAERHLTAAVATAREIGASLLEAHATLAAAQIRAGDAAEARRLAGEALALADRLGVAEIRRGAAVLLNGPRGKPH